MPKLICNRKNAKRAQGDSPALQWASNRRRVFPFIPQVRGKRSGLTVVVMGKCHFWRTFRKKKMYGLERKNRENPKSLRETRQNSAGNPRVDPQVKIFITNKKSPEVCRRMRYSYRVGGEGVKNRAGSPPGIGISGGIRFLEEEIGVRSPPPRQFLKSVFSFCGPRRDSGCLKMSSAPRDLPAGRF